MKFLTIVSSFPPHHAGGAEDSAVNLLEWLISRGHQGATLTIAEKDDSELRGELINGNRIWRLRWPRSYTPYETIGTRFPKWRKLVWHLQDHFDPRNRKLWAGVLDAWKPDIAFIQVATGLGFNGLYELARRDIPTVYFLHDLNLACGRSGMFRDGRTCKTQCASCKIVGGIRFAAASSIPRISFCSPSRANLETLKRYIPLVRYPTASILNPNRYPPPTVHRENADYMRFLFVGRIHITKGVHVALEALKELAGDHKFLFRIVGTGPEEPLLRKQYGALPWVEFTGRVSQQSVANYMANSDVLLVPSIWPENSPGVVIQALGLGLPAIGSKIGGVPELVNDGKNGLLIEPGDVLAWRSALLSLLLEKGERLKGWREYAMKNIYRFDQDHIGQQLLDFIEVTRKLPAAAH